MEVKMNGKVAIGTWQIQRWSHSLKGGLITSLYNVVQSHQLQLIMVREQLILVKSAHNR